MNIKIEFKYAVLYSLLLLLWFCIEYLVGIQDKYIALYAYFNLLSIVIPVFCIRRALLDKTNELFQKISFSQAFRSGFLITILATAFSVPVQLFFLKTLNPDFLDNMIVYAVHHGHQSQQIAQQYFNLTFYVAETAFMTFLSGTIVALILARILRTEN